LARFLIDANLPNRFVLWRGPDFELVANHDDAWTDTMVWEFARANCLTIVTKDADFTDRIMSSDPPPRVIHLRVGNMRLAELREFLIRIWPQLDQLSDTHKLLIVHRDHVECVS
jgi:predicted nuclease of predicted toxin-antitoxin system